MLNYVHMRACLHCINSVGRWTDFTKILHALFHHCVFMLQVCEATIANVYTFMQLRSYTQHPYTVDSQLLVLHVVSY